jgi:hypothetical protein
VPAILPENMDTSQQNDFVRFIDRNSDNFIVNNHAGDVKGRPLGSKLSPPLHVVSVTSRSSVYSRTA